MFFSLLTMNILDKTLWIHKKKNWIMKHLIKCIANRYLNVMVNLFGSPFGSRLKVYCYSLKLRVKRRVNFSTACHSMIPEHLSKIKGAVRRCGRLIWNQIHLTLHPDVFNVMIKMKSYLWKRERVRERDSLSLNERFQRSDNAIPIWMPSFVVRKDETNLCGFNFEAHWRRMGREGRRVRCASACEVLSPVFLEMIEMFRLVCQQIASAQHVICRLATRRERFTSKCECV